MQPILVWQDCWIPSEELSLPKKERKASQTFQNCLNITPSFEILLSSVLPTYLQQMLSQFQIVICKRSIRSGKDSGDLQSNTQCRYKNTYTQIHKDLHTSIYIWIYIGFYSFYFVAQRKKLSCYLVVESSNHLLLLRQHRQVWGKNHTTFFQENLSKAV